MKNTKQKILALLVNAGSSTTLSGVRISEETGISRVAVWKHIKALKAEGIPIASTPKGYTMESADDLLLPHCFRENIRDRIFYYPEVETTMDTAKTLAREGAPHMSCCIAEHQSRGRGRMNREWVSDAGARDPSLLLPQQEHRGHGGLLPRGRPLQELPPRTHPGGPPLPGRAARAGTAPHSGPAAGRAAGALVGITPNSARIHLGRSAPASHPVT